MNIFDIPKKIVEYFKIRKLKMEWEKQVNGEKFAHFVTKNKKEHAIGAEKEFVINKRGGVKCTAKCRKIGLSDLVDDNQNAKAEWQILHIYGEKMFKHMTLKEYMDSKQKYKI